MKAREDELYLKDFDYLGMIRLSDVVGIEELVTPIGNGEYISRAAPYWKVYTIQEASRFREYLKTLLKTADGKKAFVVVDYMKNLSGKVYYKELIHAIRDGETEGLDRARKCLLEDLANVIKLIEHKKVVPSKHSLLERDERLSKRQIELDNMGLLYIFARNFEYPRGYQILNTGLGSIHIGPFFNIMHGAEWTNILNSNYAKNSGEVSEELFYITPNPDDFKNGRMLILDDNIGTGATIAKIADTYKNAGFMVRTGAVQYNWRNYLKSLKGLKDIERFKLDEIDYITQFQYPGHKILEYTLELLSGDVDKESLPLDKKAPPPVSITSIPADDIPYLGLYDEAAIEQILRNDNYPIGLAYELYRQVQDFGDGIIPDIIKMQTQGITYAMESSAMVEIKHTQDDCLIHFNEDSKKLCRKIDEFNREVYDNTYFPGKKRGD